MVTAVRKFLIFVVAIVLLAGGAVLVLIATTPRQSAGVRVPLGPRERALIARVPESAEAFAIIPTAAALGTKVRANPVTRAALESWSASHPLPRPWMIGGADLVAWKSGKEVRYSVELDWIRGLLVRMSGSDVTGGPGEPLLDAATVGQIVDLASKLPPGDALLVQRASSRDAYPPMERPTVTSVRISASEIMLTSVGAAVHGGPAAGETPAATRFPHSAVISAAFSSAPRIVGDLNRFFGAKVSSLLEDGGMISIYDVDTRKLLPRPIGVIVLPADPARKAILDEFVKRLSGIRVRTGVLGNMLLLSFDDSIDVFQKDAFAPAAEPNAQWAVRIDPARMVPILNALGENVGLRIIAPRLFRSARDLDRWISGLERAETIEATDSVDAGVEILRVRIGSK